MACRNTSGQGVRMELKALVFRTRAAVRKVRVKGQRVLVAPKDVFNVF